MDKIINLDIPQIGEHIFASINTTDLVRCIRVQGGVRVISIPPLSAKISGLSPPSQNPGQDTYPPPGARSAP